MKEFRGKTVFVTGGGSGIGFALARAFGREGAQIALADIDFDAARQAADRLHHEQIKATAIGCDVSQRHALEHAALETIAAYGKVHIVCNNAGVAVGGPLGTIAFTRVAAPGPSAMGAAASVPLANENKSRLECMNIMGAQA